MAGEAAQSATPATATEASEASGYEEFSNLFESLTNGGKGGAQDDTTGTDAGAAGAAGNAAEPDEPGNGAGDSGKSAEAGTDAAAQNGEGAQAGADGSAAGAAAGDQVDDWKGRFESLQAQFDAFKAGAQQAAPAPAAPPQGDTPPAVYSAEERGELDTLRKDWPDIARMIELMGRQVQVDTLTYAFSEVGKVLSPLQQTVTTVSNNEHLNAIYEAHADYDQVYQPCMDWIEKQPSFLKAAYQNVAKSGTAEDVNAMIQRFKDETKWQGQAAAPAGNAQQAAPAQAASAQTTGLSDAAKKAAQAMGAVGTKRGAQAAAQDPNDFDGAWAEANSSK